MIITRSCNWRLLCCALRLRLPPVLRLLLLSSTAAAAAADVEIGVGEQHEELR